MRNAAKRRFWDHTMWGGGVVANREPGTYIPLFPASRHLDMRICCVTSPRGLHHVEYLENLNLEQKASSNLMIHVEGC